MKLLYYRIVGIIYLIPNLLLFILSVIGLEFNNGDYWQILAFLLLHYVSAIIISIFYISAKKNNISKFTNRSLIVMTLLIVLFVMGIIIGLNYEFADSKVGDIMFIAKIMMTCIIIEALLAIAMIVNRLKTNRKLL